MHAVFRGSTIAAPHSRHAVVGVNVHHSQAADIAALSRRRKHIPQLQTPNLSPHDALSLS